MEPARPFRYRPACSVTRCDRPAVYKIAAAWSNGTSRELKNYGLACAAHGESLLDAARRRLQAVRLSDGESVGPAALYVLCTGCRDTELVRLENHDDCASRGHSGEDTQTL